MADQVVLFCTTVMLIPQEKTGIWALAHFLRVCSFKYIGCRALPVTGFILWGHISSRVGSFSPRGLGCGLSPHHPSSDQCPIEKWWCHNCYKVFYNWFDALEANNRTNNRNSGPSRDISATMTFWGTMKLEDYERYDNAVIKPTHQAWLTDSNWSLFFTSNYEFCTPLISTW